MCTLTIIRETERIRLTMNRDDVAERPEAAPTVHESPKFVAPQDLLAGGTWIGVNAQGVIGCLLNRYDLAPAGRLSRGGIVMEAMSAASVAAACRHLMALDHTAYAPFTCLIAGLHETVRIDWTGTQISHQRLAYQGELMLTSSSWRFDEVKHQREHLFQQVWSACASAEERLASFHCQRDDARDFWTPMMRRERAQTKSNTQVELNQRDAEMRYWTRESALSTNLNRPDTVARIPLKTPDDPEASAV